MQTARFSQCAVNALIAKVCAVFARISEILKLGSNPVRVASLVEATRIALSSSRRLKFQKRRQLFIGMQRTAFRRRDVRQ